VGEETKLTMVPMNVGPKGLVLYAKPAFEAAGYAIPSTHEELLDLTAEVAAGGQTPWCHNWESDFATGWAGTDLLEAMVIRRHGTDVYDRWTSGELGFSSPEILEAAELVEELLLTRGWVDGGPTAILNRGFLLSAIELLETHPLSGVAGPSCMFTTLQFSALNFLGPNTPHRGPGVLGRDIGVFYFPPIEADDTTHVSGGGSMAYASSDRPEVRAFLTFMASPQWGELWAGTELDTHESFISSNQRFDAAAYQTRRSFPDDGITRRQIHDAHQAALSAGTWRFDADNLMPPGFATWVSSSSGPTAGPVWQTMVDWVSETAPVEELFAALDAQRLDYE
jgi:alpha-glucoside transport system substrate-binding protein